MNPTKDDYDESKLPLGERIIIRKLASAFVIPQGVGGEMVAPAPDPAAAWKVEVGPRDVSVLVRVRPLVPKELKARGAPPGWRCFGDRGRPERSRAQDVRRPLLSGFGGSQTRCFRMSVQQRNTAEKHSAPRTASAPSSSTRSPRQHGTRSKQREQRKHDKNCSYPLRVHGSGATANASQCRAAADMHHANLHAVLLHLLAFRKFYALISNGVSWVLQVTVVDSQTMMVVLLNDESRKRFQRSMTLQEIPSLFQRNSKGKFHAPPPALTQSIEGFYKFVCDALTSVDDGDPPDGSSYAVHVDVADPRRVKVAIEAARGGVASWTEGCLGLTLSLPLQGEPEKPRWGSVAAQQAAVARDRASGKLDAKEAEVAFKVDKK